MPCESSSEAATAGSFERKHASARRAASLAFPWPGTMRARHVRGVSPGLTPLPFRKKGSPASARVMEKGVAHTRSFRPWPWRYM